MRLYEIQGKYGARFEIVTWEESVEEGLKRLSEYRIKESSRKFRMIQAEY